MFIPSKPFGQVLPLALFFAVCLPASDLFPIYSGSSWRLASGAVPERLTLTAESYESFPALRRVRVNVTSPWIAYSLVFRSSDAGMQLEGFGSGALVSRYSEPQPFFPIGPAGTRVTGDGVQATLTSTSATVTTPAGTHTGVSVYEVIFNGTDRQVWYVKPGVGIVQFGEGQWAFRLEAANLAAAPPVAVPDPTHACPLVGIEPNPAAFTDFSAAAREAAQVKAKQYGANHMVVSTSWSELEPAPGTFNFARLDESLDRAARHSLSVSIIVKTIDTSMRTLPADLSGRAWNDPVVIARFKALLNQLVPRLNAQVQWLHLGNEVDAYLTSRPAETAPFQQFFQQGSQFVKSLRPALPVSLVFAYDTYRQTNSAFVTLSPGLPHIAFTYYAVRAPTAANPSMQRSVDNVPQDLLDMTKAANGRDLILSEVGYSSSVEAGSSMVQQGNFYSAVFSAIETGGPKIKTLNFAFLSDIPSSVATQLGAQFGGSGYFVQWLAALGATDANGVDKPAAVVFKNQALRFASGPICR